MEDFVVTGSTGLVGGTLCRKLIDAGNSVTALGRNKEKLRTLQNSGARVFSCDIREENWNYTFPKNAIWFHCAAALTGANQSTLEQINVKGMHNIIKHAKQYSAKVIVYVSSIAVYSITTNVPRTEESPKKPYSPYGKSKLLAESILQESGLNFIIVRPPFIGGPGDQNFLVEFSSRIKKRKLPLLSRNGRLGYIDARDLTDVMIRICQNPNFFMKAVNIQGQSIGFHEFVYLLSNKLGVPPPKKKIPYPIAYVLAFVVELMNGLRGKSSNRGLSRYRVKTLSSVRCLDTSFLLSQIQFEPIPLEKSIDDWIHSIE